MESTAARETLSNLQRDLNASEKERQALTSEHNSLKDTVEALRGERAKLAQALKGSEARAVATEGQRLMQAQRAERLQQELAAAVAGREAADVKLADLESQLVAATLQHKQLRAKHESAQQGSRDLQSHLTKARSAHEELSSHHSKAQDTIASLKEELAILSKEKEGLAQEVSNRDAQLKEAVEAADRAQEEAEAQVTDTARKAAEESEKQAFRIKNLESDLRSSRTHIEELEALLKASEASESVLKTKLAESQAKVANPCLFTTVPRSHSLNICGTWCLLATVARSPGSLPLG